MMNSFSSAVLLLVLVSHIVASNVCQAQNFKDCQDVERQATATCYSNPHMRQGTLSACQCISIVQLIQCFKDFCPSQLSESTIKQFELSDCRRALTDSIWRDTQHVDDVDGVAAGQLGFVGKDASERVKRDVVGGIVGDVLNSALSGVKGAAIENGVTGILSAVLPAAVDGAVNGASTGTLEPLPAKNSCPMQCVLNALDILGSPDVDNILSGLCSRTINFDAQFAQTSSAITSCVSNCGQADIATVVNDLCAGAKIVNAVVDGGKLLNSLIGNLAKRDNTNSARGLSAEILFEAVVFMAAMYFL
ncbi:hypothetical protein BDR26DRAFT_1014410 [Obelidium mucronatum]|nr:hypothetical protein BDR26DRAFT_1014410 [Obelidium mucronatum]